MRVLAHLVGSHYAATPAPWYDVTRGGTNWVDTEEVKAPRTASFGVDPSELAGHHQMIAEQPHLMAHERNAVDRQFRKRWVTLLSVDDAIAAVSESLGELNLSDSTYFFVTSDQCVHLHPTRCFETAAWTVFLLAAR